MVESIKNMESALKTSVFLYITKILSRHLILFIEYWLSTSWGIFWTNRYNKVVLYNKHFFQLEWALGPSWEWHSPRVWSSAADMSSRFLSGSWLVVLAKLCLFILRHCPENILHWCWLRLDKKLNHLFHF